MEKLTKIIFALLAVFALTGCKPQIQYIPFEINRTEYKNKLLRDSVYMYDSVFVKEKGDTVWLEKYKYIYRDKLRRDSIFKTDSIQVPYPVEIEKEVNRLTSFQSFQIWCGRILLILLIFYICIKYLRLRYLK